MEEILWIWNSVFLKVEVIFFTKYTNKSLHDLLYEAFLFFNFQRFWWKILSFIRRTSSSYYYRKRRNFIFHYLETTIIAT